MLRVNGPGCRTEKCAGEEQGIRLGPNPVLRANGTLSGEMRGPWEQREGNPWGEP